MSDERKEEGTWRLERDLGAVRITINLGGDHLNELPDAVVIEYGAQLLHGVALEQGASEPMGLWWINTKSQHHGVAIGRDEEEARSHWRATHPGAGAEIREIHGGGDLAGYV